MKTLLFLDKVLTSVDSALYTYYAAYDIVFKQIDNKKSKSSKKITVKRDTPYKKMIDKVGHELSRHKQKKSFMIRFIPTLVVIILILI